MTGKLSEAQSDALAALVRSAEPVQADTANRLPDGHGHGARVLLRTAEALERRGLARTNDAGHWLPTDAGVELAYSLWLLPPYDATPAAAS